MKGSCPYCREPIQDNLEEHLRDNHFIGIQSFYESGKSLFDSSKKCLKCGSPRVPLSTVLGANNYYLPCWRCIGDDEYEKPQAIDTVRKAIKDYYSNIEGDRYLQMYLSDPMFERETLPHGFSEFKKVLKILQGHYDIDRNKLWIPDFNPGYPRTICSSNTRGLKIIDIEKEFTIRETDEYLEVNGIKVQSPKVVPYDQRHFSRYNVLNVNNPNTDYRNTKRIRLGNKAIKFYNNQRNGVKSIFSIPKNFRTFPSGYLLVIKLLVMRDRSKFKTIESIVSNLVSSIGTFRDSVFLRNTVQVNPENPLKVNLTWYPDEIKEDFINISIL